MLGATDAHNEQLASANEGPTAPPQLQVASVQPALLAAASPPPHSLLPLPVQRRAVSGGGRASRLRLAGQVLSSDVLAALAAAQPCQPAAVPTSAVPGTHAPPLVACTALGMAPLPCKEDGSGTPGTPGTPHLLGDISLDCCTDNPFAVCRPGGRRTAAQAAAPTGTSTAQEEPLAAMSCQYGTDSCSACVWPSTSNLQKVGCASWYKYDAACLTHVLLGYLHLFFNSSISKSASVCIFAARISSFPWRMAYRRHPGAPTLSTRLMAPTFLVCHAVCYPGQAQTAVPYRHLQMRQTWPHTSCACQ